MALFGRNSFLDSRLTNTSVRASYVGDSTVSTSCMNINPLELLRDDWHVDRICTEYTADGDDVWVESDVSDWLQDLFATYAEYPESDTWELKKLFTSAAFIANQAWLLHQPSDNDLQIQRDLGLDTVIPSISFAGIIIISSLLATYLFILSLFAVYAARRSDIVDTKLNAWAMMKVGAIHADRIRPSENKKAEDVPYLDHSLEQLGRRLSSLDEESIRRK